MNPMNVLQEMYDTQLESENDRGYADIYKQCTEEFVKQLESCEDTQFHVEDLRYEDGYFIFAHGSNAVVKFHIRECPGWLFGIWWSVPESETHVQISFFAQFEATIDKFKPSASMLVETCTYASLESGIVTECYDFYRFPRMVNYIYEVPALAFCRDYFYYDYNKEYLSLEAAEAKFKETIEKLHKKERVTAELDAELIDFYNRKILPAIPGSYLRDDGKNTCPRYQLCVPNSCLDLDLKLEGYYALQPFLDDSIFAQLKDCYKLLDNSAEAEDITWYPPIDMNIQVFMR